MNSITIATARVHCSVAAHFVEAELKRHTQALREIAGHDVEGDQLLDKPCTSGGKGPC